MTRGPRHGQRHWLDWAFYALGVPLAALILWALVESLA